MVAAYIGYKIGGFVGAAVAAAASFLPSFILMLSILPIFERVRALAWTRAVMKGVGPAVIGVLAVFLVRMAGHALPDRFSMVMFVVTVIALLGWRVNTVKLLVGGAAVGVLRTRFLSLPGVRAALGHIRAQAGA